MVLTLQSSAANETPTCRAKREVTRLVVNLILIVMDHLNKITYQNMQQLHNSSAAVQRRKKLTLIFASKLLVGFRLRCHNSNRALLRDDRSLVNSPECMGNLDVRNDSQKMWPVDSARLGSFYPPAPAPIRTLMRSNLARCEKSSADGAKFHPDASGCWYRANRDRLCEPRLEVYRSPKAKEKWLSTPENR